MRLTSEGFDGGAPGVRVRAVNAAPVRPDGAFVLYWMIGARRSRWNFALDRAMAWAVELRRPLVVLEALRVDYPFASARLHRFVLDGMVDNAAAFEGTPVRYIPYVEPDVGHGKGLLDALAAEAAVVVTDDFPCFFLPAVVAAAGSRLQVQLEAVDGNGLLPLRVLPQAYPAAVHHRRFMQRVFREHVVHQPVAEPRFADLPTRLGSLPAGVEERWPPASELLLKGSSGEFSRLPIDHSVPVAPVRGGSAAGGAALHRFAGARLATYHDAHNHPDDDGSSRLSPYLHFGHVSAHEVFETVMRAERWNLGRLAPKASGLREGWWGASPGAEAFLDQLVVWRELGYSMCFHRPADYDRFESLPPWALHTLQEHASDARPYIYTAEQFEAAATHDPVWNAAQREMLRDGWMHNYMRMLWGKKILEWSATPEAALETMVRLMNRWCLDGRDPNSYAGYMWILGRYDRPWPERPVYGVIRSMSSESAMRKLRLSKYLARNGGGLFDGA